MYMNISVTCSNKENPCSQDDVPFTFIETTSSNAHSSHKQQDGTKDREDVGSPDYPWTVDKNTTYSLFHVRITWIFEDKVEFLEG